MIALHNPFSDWQSVVSELKSENINGSVWAGAVGSQTASG